LSGAAIVDKLGVIIRELKRRKPDYEDQHEPLPAAVKPNRMNTVQAPTAWRVIVGRTVVAQRQAAVEAALGAAGKALVATDVNVNEVAIASELTLELTSAPKTTAGQN